MRALAAAGAILQSSQLDRGQDLSRECDMFGECKNHRIADPISFAKSRLDNYIYINIYIYTCVKMSTEINNHKHGQKQSIA